MGFLLFRVDTAGTTAIFSIWATVATGGVLPSIMLAVPTTTP